MERKTPNGQKEINRIQQSSEYKSRNKGQDCLLSESSAVLQLFAHAVWIAATASHILCKYII